MAEKTPERFYLEVLSGEEKGVTCWVNPEKPVLLGCGESAGLKVRGPGVKTEHAVVSLLKGRTWLENLSSGGSLLNGRSIRSRTVIMVGEVIGLGDEVKVALRSTKTQSASNTSPLLLPLLLALVVLCGALLAIMSARPRASTTKRNRPITAAQWENAYQRILTRLGVWSSQDRLPLAYKEAFTQAWYRDQGGDLPGARENWKQLYNAMIGLAIPGATPPGKTLANSAEASPDALTVLMGRDPNRDPDNTLMWSGDDAAYASAWWWFVNNRIDETQPKKK